MIHNLQNMLLSLQYEESPIAQPQERQLGDVRTSGFPDDIQSSVLVQHGQTQQYFRFILGVEMGKQGEYTDKSIKRRNSCLRIIFMACNCRFFYMLYL